MTLGSPDGGTRDGGGPNSGGNPSTVQAWRPLALFFAGNVCLAAGLFVHAFLFNFYLRDLGLPASAMGHQAAAITLGGLLALLPAGLVIDRVGLRPALFGAVIVATAGLTLTALARRPATIYPAAMLIGLGAATWRVALGPALMCLTSEAGRARAFTWNVALLVGTGGAWTLLAGVLPTWSSRMATTAGLSGTQLTLIAGAALSAAAVICYWPLRVPRAPASAQLAIPLGLPREVRALIPLVAVWMLAAALVLPFFNVFFHDRFGMPVSRVGALFAGTQLMHAVMLIGAAEVARRWGPRRALVAWMLALAPSLWWLAATDALSLAIGLYVVQGLIAPATNPLIDQVLLERAPRSHHGLVAGWRNAATEGAGALGASAGGRVLDASSFSTLFVIAGAVAAASSAALALALRERHGRTIAPGVEAA
jgi:MFS family permease